MSAVKLIPVTRDALETVASNMRDADRIEVSYFNHTPLEALVESVKVSQFVTVVTVDGEPVSVIGLRRLNHLSSKGVPWMLSSSTAVKHRKLFMSLTSSVINDMLSICPHLLNYVHEHNKLSIRWLTRLGFTVVDECIDVNGGKFHKFYMESSHV